MWRADAAIPESSLIPSFARWIPSCVALVRNFNLCGSGEVMAPNLACFGRDHGSTTAAAFSVVLGGRAFVLRGTGLGPECQPARI